MFYLNEELKTGELGQSIINPFELSKLITIQGELENRFQEFKIKRIVRKSPKETEVITNSDFKIIFNLEDSIPFQVENLYYLLTNNPEIKGNLERLEYIDLRFGRRLFYKLKETNQKSEEVNQ